MVLGRVSVSLFTQGLSLISICQASAPTTVPVLPQEFPWLYLGHEFTWSFTGFMNKGKGSDSLSHPPGLLCPSATWPALHVSLEWVCVSAAEGQKPELRYPAPWDWVSTGKDRQKRQRHLRPVCRSVQRPVPSCVCLSGGPSLAQKQASRSRQWLFPDDRVPRFLSVGGGPSSAVQGLVCPLTARELAGSRQQACSSLDL